MSRVESATAMPIRGRGERSGWAPVRRATSLVLWQAAPWVLLVLLVTSVLGLGTVAWLTWSVGAQGGSTGVYLQADGGVAWLVALFVAVATLLSWTRAVRTVVPVLVAGGVTRRALTAGLLVGAAALAMATTGVLAVVSVAGAALHRAIAARPGAVAGPASSDDPYLSALAGSYAEGSVFDPVGILAWCVLAALAGALVGAAWYRWRARGAFGTALVLLVAWIVGFVVVSVVTIATDSAVVDALGSPPLLELLLCPVLAAAVWLVLRRAPLRQVVR